MTERNCPNCGANLVYEGGLHCEFCGAWFEEPRTVSVRVEADGELEAMMARGILTPNECRRIGGLPVAPTQETR